MLKHGIICLVFVAAVSGLYGDGAVLRIGYAPFPVDDDGMSDEVYKSLVSSMALEIGRIETSELIEIRDTPEDLLLEDSKNLDYLVKQTFNSFSLEPVNTEEYRAKIEVSFSIYKIPEKKEIGNFVLRVIGVDIDKDQAVLDAVSDIPIQFSYELRKIKDFDFGFEIRDIMGNTLVLNKGKKDGIRKNQELTLYAVREGNKGIPVKTGFIIVREVEDKISFANVIFTEGVEPAVGDKVTRIKRSGLETTLYLRTTFNIFTWDYVNPVFTIGIKQSFTKLRCRPVLGVETLFFKKNSGIGGIPINVYIGPEFSWHLKRIQFLPMVAFGLGWAASRDRETKGSIMYVGGIIQLSTNIVIKRWFGVSIDMGYSQWFPLDDSREKYGGFHLGTGFQFKY